MLLRSDITEDINKPLNIIKSRWENLKPSKIYLAKIVCGSHFIALVQTYDRPTHGSVLVTSYGFSNPMYAWKDANGWHDTTLVTNTDLTAKSLGASNLNDIKTHGIYFQSHSANATTERNYPAEDAGFLEVMFAETGFVLQKYNTHSSSAVYKRTYNNSGWGGWRQV